MARKKPAEEHENLERWLVSYADFMTLLFATFVVLYALAQSDISTFKGIEEALKKAFSQNIFDNQTAIMTGQDSIFDGQTGATNPIMLEYMSQKYEQSSYEDIKSEIDKLKNEGISAEINDRGLIIRMNEHSVKFAAGTADLTKESYAILDLLADIIKRRFAIHYIDVEGHSDSDNIKTPKFPSNWELSSARASSVVRYLIDNHDFNPKIFTAIGLADTIPVAKNDTLQNKAKNRRVEIVILRNKHKNLSKKDMQQILKEAKLHQKKNAINSKAPSQAIEGLVGNDREMLKNVIDMSEQYENESKRINSLDDDSYLHDGARPNFMEQ
ncbi:MAG: OmpA family protein [Candidatus Gastranaerophilales bacterium]|nr:OmpA family protein [Candidatus Gastranaerophilales bacterium]